MFIVTLLISCNAGHFFKITATTTLLQNKILSKHLQKILHFNEFFKFAMNYLRL